MQALRLAAGPCVSKKGGGFFGAFRGLDALDGKPPLAAPCFAESAVLEPGATNESQRLTAYTLGYMAWLLIATLRYTRPGSK